jgi:Mg-chelatase subunit ChlD
VLPDCQRFTDDVTSDDLLDTLDPAELARALAEHGVAGAHELLRQSGEREGELARRLARLRERLRRQAERQTHQVTDQYDRRLEELQIAEHRTQEEIDREIAELEGRLRAARAGRSTFTMPEFLPDVTAALLVPDAPWNQPPPRPSIWQRIRAWFAALFARIFGRRKRAPKPKEGRRIPIARLSPDGRTLGPSEFAEALAQLNPDEARDLGERVAGRLEHQERELGRTAEAKRRDAEAQRRRLEEERREALKRAESQVDRTVREAEDRRVDRELRERGFVAERGGELVVTYGLVERFARLLLEEERRTAPTDVRFALQGGAATGVYEKARLRQSVEVARLDVSSSLVAARLAGLRHIDEGTSYVYREATGESVHVVLAFDRSGSMAEGGKLEAAKKALLALYVAVRRKYPAATIDVLAFENEVKVLDLVELWECSPGAFTNTAEGLGTAYRLLANSRASRREVYFITDGLPEAYTDAVGVVHSGRLDLAMDQALTRARELATLAPLRFSMILLKSEHPEYEAAARAITRTLNGELVVTDPQHLGVELLIRWTRGSETVRRVATPAPIVPRPRGTPASAQGRRRRADRRMGG